MRTTLMGRIARGVDWHLFSLRLSSLFLIHLGGIQGAMYEEDGASFLFS